MADYFDPIKKEILEAQKKDPEVVLPWSWWQAWADRVGMSPNALYTRATKSGLYIAPAKRTKSPAAPASPDRNETKRPDAIPERREPERPSSPPEATPRTETRNVPTETVTTAPSPTTDSSAPVEEPIEEESIESEKKDPAPVRSSSRTSSSAPSFRSVPPSPAPTIAPSAPIPFGISEALHGFTALVERNAVLEQQVQELLRTVEQTQEENRRLRRALGEVEELYGKIGRIYRSTLHSD